VINFLAALLLRMCFLDPASSQESVLICVNEADGISDVERKAVMGSSERAGKRASFNSVDDLCVLRVLCGKSPCLLFRLDGRGQSLIR
jgi:hypothetical protein